MYIELGSTKINYKKSTGSNFIILSQVVNSALSYEKPVIVNNVQDFDIWFGRDFSDRDFLVELLEMGISLYLYKPVSSEISSFGIEGYIDYSKYQRYNKISYYELSRPDFKKDGETIYPVITEDSKIEDYIWDKDNENFIRVIDLPQNQTLNNSKSLNNRDTLSIFEDITNKKYIYVSPIYEANILSNELNDEVFRKIDKIDKIDNSIPKELDYVRLENNLQTLAYNILVDDSELFKTIDEELNYIVIGNTFYGFCSRENFSVKVNKEWLTIQENMGPNKTYIKVTNAKDINDILKCFSEGSIEGNKYILETLENVKHQYNISGFSLEPDFNYTNEIIYSKLISNNNYKNKINFISKTIGTGDIDGEIKVKIEKATDSIYRIIISRFGYFEIFEGEILGDKDNLSLEEQINLYSKLVYSTIKDNNLPVGEWSLRGGFKEEYSGNMYLKSLICLLNPPEPIYFDYLLIPDINRYPIDRQLSKDGSYYYYKIYDDLVQISKQVGCQVLIQNSPGEIKKDFDYETTIKTEEYKVNLRDELHKDLEMTYENTFVEVKVNLDTGFVVEDDNLSINTELCNMFGNLLSLVGTHKDISESVYSVRQGNYQYNYIEDSENRLIYFYDSINIYGESRPGYYLYLMNLLIDTYSATSDKILYNTPVQEYYTSFFNKNIKLTKDDLLTYQLEIVNMLEEKKCNYLLSNNHIYYYEKYLNGSNFTTTGWMRFCIEKIKRELIKNKWLILDNRDYSNIEKSIKQILNRIKNNFSIIKDISLADLEISYKDKKIDIKIDSIVSDLVNNGIRIDVTLNYNA